MDAPTGQTSVTLPFQRFDALLDLGSADPVSRFLGATIRGGFGYTLRGLVCAARGQQCPACMLRHGCVYCFLFESAPPPGAPRLGRYSAVPRPFTLRCSQDANAMTVAITLFGSAIQYLPHFIYTLNKLGEQGLGKHKTRYAVRRVCAAGRTVYPVGDSDVDLTVPPAAVTVAPGTPAPGIAVMRFATPLTLRKEGELLGRIDGRTLVTTLLRRITTLAAFYAPPQPGIDPRPFIDAAERLTVTADLARTNLERFSTRQQTRIDYSGFTGAVTLSGDVGTLMPLLKAGEITGVGKNTVFGCGVYELQTTQDRNHDV